MTEDLYARCAECGRRIAHFPGGPPWIHLEGHRPPMLGLGHLPYPSQIGPVPHISTTNGGGWWPEEYQVRAHVNMVGDQQGGQS